MTTLHAAPGHTAPHTTAPRHTAPRHTASALPDLGTLVPWRAWLHHPALRTGPVAVVLALVVVPPLGLRLADRDLDTAVVLFAAYFAAAWWLLLRTVLRPVSPGAAMTTGLVLLALFTQIPIAVLLERMLDADTEHLFAGILGVGVPEELVKALPVAAVVLTLRSRGRLLEARDVLFLGVISGIVFGAAEAVHYVLDVPSEPLTKVWRLVANPAIHGAWAGIAAFFLGLAVRRDPAQWAPLAGLGLAIAAVLHGVSNWLVGSWAWVAVAGVSALLLLAYSTVGVPTGTATRPTPEIGPEIDPPTAPLAFRGPDGRWWA